MLGTILFVVLIGVAVSAVVQVLLWRMVLGKRPPGAQTTAPRLMVGQRVQDRSLGGGDGSLRRPH